MRIYGFLFFLLLTGLLSAQISDYTARQVYGMAVYPGCEEFQVEQKAELSQCLSKNLTLKLTDLMNDFWMVLEDFNTEKAVCRIQFVIDKDGKMVDIRPMETNNYLNQLLGLVSASSMRKIAEQIPPIQPATLDDGSPVSMIFVLPVNYQIEEIKNPNPLSDYDFTEMVNYTLKSDLETFEIRIEGKTGKFKAYEISGDKAVFLGQFNSFGDVLQLEPYRSLYFSSGDKHLVTEKNTDGTVYRIYMKDSEPDRVFVYRLENNTEELEAEFSGRAFSWSKYSAWILR
ncbi:MAG: hypothetical protein WCY16_00905 [Weeksellaceae bacterium]